jgi:hypothetical protein
MNETIINAYNNANVYANKQSANKTYKYVILDHNLCASKSGLCTNVHKRYDPIDDCNWVYFNDIETGEEFCEISFYVRLTEI